MELEIVFGDITRVRADLVILKYASGFHGADDAVARSIGFSDDIPVGEKRLVATGRTSPSWAMFISVGPLYEFRYEQIQKFAAGIFDFVEEANLQVVSPFSHIALTIHGPGYGLDTRDSFLSLVAGLVEGLETTPSTIERVTIVERNEKRCEFLKQIFRTEGSKFHATNDDDVFSFVVSSVRQKIEEPSHTATILKFGERADLKPHLFVAMPFSETYLDEFQLGISEAGNAHGYNCERLDMVAFTGDIVAEIKKRIISSDGVVALLNELNPNVFLELGFALAHELPTVLIAKDGLELPFDVQGLKCLRYKNIVSLKRDLTTEIGLLKAQGVLYRRA